MSTRRQRLEQTDQRALLDHLRWRGAPDLFAFHVPNGGWRSPVEAMVLKGLGVTPGVPDIIIVHAGKCLCAGTASGLNSQSISVPPSRACSQGAYEWLTSYGPNAGPPRFVIWA